MGESFSVRFDRDLIYWIAIIILMPERIGAQYGEYETFENLTIFCSVLLPLLLLLIGFVPSALMDEIMVRQRSLLIQNNQNQTSSMILPMPGEDEFVSMDFIMNKGQMAAAEQKHHRHIILGLLFGAAALYGCWYFLVYRTAAEAMPELPVLLVFTSREVYHFISRHSVRLRKQSIYLHTQRLLFGYPASQSWQKSYGLYQTAMMR